MIPVQIPALPDCGHPNSVSRACLMGVCARGQAYRRERRTFQTVSAFPVGAIVRDAYWLSEWEVVKAGDERKPWVLRCVEAGLRPDTVGAEHTNYDNDPRYELAASEAVS